MNGGRCDHISADTPHIDLVTHLGDRVLEGLVRCVVEVLASCWWTPFGSEEGRKALNGIRAIGIKHNEAVSRRDTDVEVWILGPPFTDLFGIRRGVMNPVARRWFFPSGPQGKDLPASLDAGERASCSSLWV